MGANFPEISDLHWLRSGQGDSPEMPGRAKGSSNPPFTMLPFPTLPEVEEERASVSEVAELQRKRRRPSQVESSRLSPSGGLNNIQSELSHIHYKMNLQSD